MNELDKKIFKVVGLLALGTVLFYITWWFLLPVTINRRDDIEFGNSLIRQIEEYKRTNGLPDTNDEQTLIKLGFKVELYGQPTYQKLNDTSFQVFYPKGFDPPYLTWDSNTKNWRMDFPEIPDDWKKEKE
jgi:hypothetical protein